MYVRLCQYIYIVLKPKASTGLRQSPACRDPKRDTFQLPEYVGVSNIRITVDHCGPQHPQPTEQWTNQSAMPTPIFFSQKRIQNVQKAPLSCGFSGIDRLHMVLIGFALRSACQVVNAGIHPSLVDTFGRRCTRGTLWLYKCHLRYGNCCCSRVEMSERL